MPKKSFGDSAISLHFVLTFSKKRVENATPEYRLTEQWQMTKLGLEAFFADPTLIGVLLAPCIITEIIVVDTHYIITLLIIVWDKFLVSHVTCIQAVTKQAEKEEIIAVVMVIAKTYINWFRSKYDLKVFE